MLTVEDVRTLYNLFTGRPVIEEKTDARWSKPGTTTVNGYRHAGRWSFMSYRRRAAITWWSAAAVVVLAAGLWTSPVAAIAAIRLIGWFYLFPAALWCWWDFERRRQHRRDVLAPLGVALAQRLNDARYQLNPRDWIDTPVDPLDRATLVYLPIGYDPTESQEKSLAKLIARRIGLVSPSWKFYLQGEAPYVELTPAPAPRDVVGFSQEDVRKMLDERPEGQLLLGLGPRDTPVYVDLESESPHVGLSVATGGGKSVAARSLAMQVLRDGGIVLVLDRKIESQLWAIDHPGVRYACSEAEIYRALIEASAEINRRFELVRQRRFAHEPLEREEIGPRLLIICEELNALEIDLRIWWRALRDPGDPAQCPALPVLGRILAMGRAGRVHMVVIAQKLTCQAIGGTAARENLSTRILGRATTSTWNMLAPECKIGGRFPKSTRHRGRVHVVVGDEATPTQVMFAGETEAFDYSMAGVVREFPDLVAEVEAAFADVSPGAMTRGEVPQRLALLTGGEGDEDDDETEGGALVTLAAYAHEHDLKLKSLLNARDRDAFGQPERSGRGKPSWYRREVLDEWRESRMAGVGGGTE